MVAQVAALDAELHAKGLLSLSQVRQRVWGRYAAIVKHGQVRNDADAQVVRAVLADAVLAAALPEAERADDEAKQPCTPCFLFS